MAANCVRGETYLDLDRNADAIEAFKAELDSHPLSGCAIEGLEAAGPSEATQLAGEITGSIPDVLVFAGLALLLGFGLLLFGYQRHLGRWMRRIWGVRRILGPRLTIEVLEDEAVEGKPGAPFTARVKDHLRRARDEAESERASEYSLDFGTPEQEFADVVSGSGGLKSSLEKASEISDQTQVVGALLDVVYALLPIPRFEISGAAEPPADGAAGATLLLESNKTLEAAITVRDRVRGRRTPAAGDYVDLADLAAVWIQYEIARVLDSKAVELDAAESWLLVRKGLDHYAREEVRQARASFGEAIRWNRRNWAAVLGVAMTEARLRGRFDRAIALLEQALVDMEERRMARRPAASRPPNVVRSTFSRTRLGARMILEDPTEGAPYLAEPDYYRLGYQLVAQQLNSLHADSPEEEGSSADGDGAGVLRSAKKLQSQSFEVRRWLWRRSRAPGWRLWNSKLTPKEKRLSRFLFRTVEPCLAIAIAAERHQDRRPNEQALKRLRRRAERGSLSYRALYGLACYEASATRNEKRALSYLRQALREAPGDRVTELLRWAPKDPSLSGLSRSSAFQDLLSNYGA